MSESVEAALELKDVTVLTKLLALFTGGPVQLSQHCSGIVQLCTVQQLAAELAVQQPIEGVPVRLMWLKHLIMGLIFNPALTGLDEKTQLVPVMSGVLTHLRAGEARLQTNSPRSGSSEDGCLSPTATDAELTDLRMIIALMSHKY
jgi:hypothetical protein